MPDYRDSIAKCSHCNFCQATCPVYLEDILETHEPRARLEIIRRTLIEGSLSKSDRFKEILDRCLLCTSCSRICPAGIPVHGIIATARNMVYKGKRKNMAVRFLLRSIMERRGIHGVMGKVKNLAGSLGIKGDLPTPASRPFSEEYKGILEAEGERRARVVYYVGCATNSIYTDTGRDVLFVLRKNGIEVVLPAGLVCCGMPALGEGDLGTAREMMGKNLKILSKLDFDALVVECTSCGLMFRKDAAALFDEDDPLREQAEKVAAMTWEATDYLEMIGMAAAPAPLDLALTYHVPCHGWMTESVKDAPRRLMEKIPGVKLIEMEHPERCCGAGGGFFMENPNLAESIRSRKIDEIERTTVKTVLTQCPGCRFFIQGPLENHRVVHPLSVLARAYEIRGS